MFPQVRIVHDWDADRLSTVSTNKAHLSFVISDLSNSLVFSTSDTLVDVGK